LNTELARALEYARLHPDDYGGITNRLAAVWDHAQGTPVGARAAAEIVRVREAREEAIRNAMKTLKANADHLWSQGRYNAAISRVKGYSGPWSAETADARAALLKELRAKKPATAPSEPDAEADTGAASDNQPEESPEQRAASADAARKKQEAQARLRGALDGVAGALLQGRLAEARDLCQALRNDGGLSPVADECSGAADLVEQLASMPEEILGTFTADQGKDVLIAFKTGLERVRVVEAAPDGVVVRKGTEAPRTIHASDLAPQEKLRRLSREKDAYHAIMRGLAAAEAGDETQAEQCFGEANCDLGRALIRALAKEQGAPAAEPKTGDAAARGPRGSPSADTPAVKKGDARVTVVPVMLAGL
jgi:hypothetical protein